MDTEQYYVLLLMSIVTLTKYDRRQCEFNDWSGRRQLLEQVEHYKSLMYTRKQQPNKDGSTTGDMFGCQHDSVWSPDQFAFDLV